MTNPYTFTDNPTESGVAVCNTDKLNDDIMCLKWYYDHISFRNIGEIVASTIPLTDSGLHLLDGTLLSGSGIYADFVTYIAGLYNSNQSASYFTSESDWQDSVTAYGVCGKFVYNSINNTVRLPKVTGFIEGAGGISTLGNLTEAGLPDHTHNIELDYGTNDGSYGVLDSATSKTGTASFVTGNVSASSIYGNSNTVQPQSVKVLYYIAVASLTKTEIQVDIDEIATDLNGKADVDLSNVSNPISDAFLSIIMPDYDNEINIIHFDSSDKFQTPCAGLFCGNFMWSGAYTFEVRVEKTGSPNYVTVGKYIASGSNSHCLSVYVLLNKGEKIWQEHSSGLGTWSANMGFYPLKGASSGGV